MPPWSHREKHQNSTDKCSPVYEEQGEGRPEGGSLHLTPLATVIPHASSLIPRKETLAMLYFLFPHSSFWNKGLHSRMPHLQHTMPIITPVHTTPWWSAPVQQKYMFCLLWSRTAQRSSFLARDQILPLGRTIWMGCEWNANRSGIWSGKKKKKAPHIVLSASLSLWLEQTAPKVTLEAICWRRQRPHTAVLGCLCEEGCPAELVNPPYILNKLEISIVFQPLIIWGWVSLLDWVPPPTDGHLEQQDIPTQETQADRLCALM